MHVHMLHMHLYNGGVLFLHAYKSVYICMYTLMYIYILIYLYLFIYVYWMTVYMGQKLGELA